ncbi:MAG: MATE family efflux transporter [Gammaproteobacteria bacterium]|nr:MATE family efflux transporter [Gammaproteobacteria bacterium]NIN37244.1 MATE family efflux transporter [Gammaproteobacteria bacterium]NIO26102.1 MATE family efflux transporter [Gammaproteobacteria bacterium]NIO66715.1 MATE family efflux transporter [Gammaproteobacteria bacterium]NIP65868.1 MATE family efflux transporter [Gammaproteobacteria bacterium]
MWTLAWPIILSNVSVPLVGIVDTAVVGHLPNPVFIGAVALGTVVFSFLYWGFGFLRMGTTGLVAQDLGAEDWDELRATLARALIIASVLGLTILVLRGALGELAFWALEGSARVEAFAKQYYQVRVFGAPAALINFVVLGFVIGIQNTRAALALLLLLNVMNVLLDLLFVVGFGWGVEGVAAASLISEYSAAVFGLLLVRGILTRLGGRWQSYRLFDRSRMKTILSVNLNIFVRTLCLLLAFFHFTSTGARLGDVVLAANAVLMHFQMFMAYSLDGFAHAVEALAGSAYGARNRHAFTSAVRASTVCAAAVAVVYVLVYAMLGSSIIALITGIEEVRSMAAAYLPWLIATPIVSVWSFQLDGIFIATTRTVAMRNAMLVSLAVFLIGVWTLLPLWGNHGLWAAFIVFMVSRAVTLAIGYPRIVRDLPQT